MKKQQTPSIIPNAGNSPYKISLDSLSGQSLLALLSAVLLILSFPIFDLSFLCWIALTPLLLALTREISWKRAFFLGWLTGIVFTWFAENWIAHSMTHYGGILTGLAYAITVIFAAVLAVFPALFAVIMARLLNRWGWTMLVLAPVIWVATEWLRPQVTGVTWNALGVSQAGHYSIARLSQYGGVYLVSAELVAGSALLLLATRMRQRGVGRSAAVLLMIAAILFGLPDAKSERPPEIDAEVRVVGVQPNLAPDSSNAPEDFEKNLEANIRLTRQGIDAVPGKVADLVIWAESPLAIFYENDSAVRERLNTLARETGSYFILNTVTRDDWRYYNSIHTINPDSSTADSRAFSPLKRYDKIRLVPFGEYVPLRSLLGRFIPAITGDFTPGTQAVVNMLRLNTRRAEVLSDADDLPAGSIERTTNFIQVGAFICYEAAYPDLVRKFVNNGASLLINVSNDTWFGNTAGARQHLSHAIFRAIENDRDLLRVTNSGISTLITAEGKVVDPLPSFTPNVGNWLARPHRGRTAYTLHGDIFAIGCTLLSSLIIAFTIFRRPRPVKE